MGIIAGKASIIILTYNGLDYTRGCLESIYQKTNGPDFEVIIVDNASQDETPAYLEAFAREHPNCKVILNDKNEGFARGNNIGAAAATGEYLVFLNNDTIVTLGWLEGLIRYLADPQVGIVGPVTNSAGNQARILVDYEDINDIDEFARQRSRDFAGQSFEIPALAFFCAAMRHSAFLDIGPLDERFGLGMFEDDDYALRLQQKGYQLLCAEDVFVHHWGGGSFLKMKEYEYWRLFRENRQKFEQKWERQWQPHLHRPSLQSHQIIELFEGFYYHKWATLLLDQQVEALKKQVAALKEEVAEIQRSTGWKLVKTIWRLRLFLAPPNSLQERIYLWLRGKPARQTDHESDSSARASKIPRPLPHEKQQENIRSFPIPDNIKSQYVPILAPQFFNFSGDTLYLGGAERYLIELAALIKELGYSPVVYQSAVGAWEREYTGIPVIGLDTDSDLRRLNEQFHQLVPEGALSLHLAFFTAFPLCHRSSIGISHGVFWDELHTQDLPARMERFSEVLAPLENLKRLVSVDTNTINWVRTMQPHLAEKFTYIPNFVDLSQFRSASQDVGEKLVILYPRRLYPPRGFWLVKEIVTEFLVTYPNVEFHFIGQADPLEERAVQMLQDQFPGRVIWRSLPMEEMHQAYQVADITLIPTLHSEGTSLSCLEAMASGNAVIATHVGGLPDLIMPGYNGLLVEPSVPALKAALHLLCQDKDLRKDLSRHALELVQNFGITQWRARWRKVLSEFI
jgi:GT2 family glycosyltransferase/glycosyltransferase involved in cell wall biosynthesis